MLPTGYLQISHAQDQGFNRPNLGTRDKAWGLHKMESWVGDPVIRQHPQYTKDKKRYLPKWVLAQGGIGGSLPEISKPLNF